MKVKLHRIGDVIHSGRSSEFARHRSDPRIRYATRHDPLRPSQVAVNVQRQPVHRDTACHPHSNGRDLSLAGFATPHTAASRDALSVDIEITTRANRRFLQPPDECDNIERLRQRNDRIDNELARAMPGNPSAAVDVDHAATVDRTVFRLGAPSGSEHVAVLQQQHGRLSLSRGNTGVYLALLIPCELIVNRRARQAGAVHDKCHGTTVREDVPVTAVVFLHGVGGPTPGWDDVLRAKVARAAPAIADSLDISTIEFADLIARRGVIRRVPAEHLHVPVVTHNTPEIRLNYYLRQQHLRAVTWRSRNTVSVPRLKWPYLIPGEFLVRMPIWDMRQAGHYRHDHELRAAVLDRIADELAQHDGDVLLFAHSLGSVVALDALHVRDIKVSMLVTLGSPLGIRHFWGKRWEDAQNFPYERVGAWLNVVNVRDPVPWTRGVNKRFPQAVDAYIDTGDAVSGENSYHAPAMYAGSGPVVTAVVDFARRARARTSTEPVDDASARVHL